MVYLIITLVYDQFTAAFGVVVFMSNKMGYLIITLVDDQYTAAFGVVVFMSNEHNDFCNGEEQYSRRYRLFTEFEDTLRD
jgi:hypothetical protein